MSISILTMIAIQRYKKVCRPFAPNMTRFWMRIFLLVSVIVSFTLSVPTAIFYGSVEVFNTELNITGFSCKKIQNEEDTGFLFYGFLVVAMMIFILSLLVFLYGRIIYTLHKHFKKCRNIKITFKSIKPANRNQDKDETGNKGNTCVTENHAEINNGNITTNNTEINKGKITTTNSEVNSKLNHKLTTMFLVITVVFILSYAPKVVLIVVEGFDDTLWDNLSDSTRNGLTFVNEIFILNNIINPFVYTFMDTKFRKESKFLCSGMFRKRNYTVCTGHKIKHSVEMYSTQHYVAKFVRDLRSVGGFSLSTPVPMKLTATT